MPLIYYLYNLHDMKKRYLQPVIFALLVGVLTNACGWGFNSEVFAHELDHAHHVHSLDPAAHLEAHHQTEADDEDHLDAGPIYSTCGRTISAIFLHAAIDPTRFGAIEVLTVFVPATIPDSILDSPLHPPRSILVA